MSTQCIYLGTKLLLQQQIVQKQILTNPLLINTMKSFSCHLLLSALSCACASGSRDDAQEWTTWRQQQLAAMPENMVLHAPYTPFANNASRSLVTTGIPALAKRAAASGVTVVWVAGSMGQFDSMTLFERKVLNAAWVAACKLVVLYGWRYLGRGNLRFFAYCQCSCFVLLYPCSRKRCSSKYLYRSHHLVLVTQIFR